MTKYTDVDKMTCQECGGVWYEWDGKGLDSCPYCGAKDAEHEYAEVALSLNPLTGEIDAEVA